VRFGDSIAPLNAAPLVAARRVPPPKCPRRTEGDRLFAAALVAPGLRFSPAVDHARRWRSCSSSMSEGKTTRMSTTKRIGTRIALAGAFLLLAFGALAVWNKHDFCRGWADHYASRARQLRADARNPSLTPADRREHLIAAEWHDIISHKYSAVARQPWRSYRHFPLVTPDEQRIAAAKY
jgi:hypothetical protein